MDATLPEQHLRLASSKYATIIVGLTVFLMAGTLALDRYATLAEQTRLELIRRRNHANEMLSRLEQVRNKDAVILLQLAYQCYFVGSSSTAGQIQPLNDGSYYVRHAEDVPTGLMGNEYVPPLDPSESKTTEAFLKDAKDLSDAVYPWLIANTKSANLDEQLSRVWKQFNRKGKDITTDGERQFRLIAPGLYAPIIDENVIAWVVAGRFISLEPDHEWINEVGGGGYPPAPKAAADGPVFSAPSLAGKTEAAVREVLTTYRTDLEKALLQQKVDANTGEILNSGIKLRLEDLVGLAGPLLALTQVLYLLALAQETSGARRRKESGRSSETVASLERAEGEIDYPQFPRFRSPIDLFGTKNPVTFEGWLERAVYGAFLVVPVLVLTICWATKYHFSWLQTTGEQILLSLIYLGRQELSVYQQSSTYLQLMDDARRQLGTSALANLNLFAVGLSLYCVHRSVLTERRTCHEPRFSRRSIIYCSGLIAAVAGGFFCWRDHPRYAIGAALWGTASVLCAIWPLKKSWWRWALLLAAIVAFGSVLRWLLDQNLRWSYPDRANWGGTDWVMVISAAFPLDGNAMVPVFYITAGLLASIRRRQRFMMWFFGALSACLFTWILL